MRVPSGCGARGGGSKFLAIIFPMNWLCSFALLFFGVTAFADGPTTPNPGLKYYYPIPPADPPQTYKVDVCVYGGTPGGVAAAVQARRMGKTAVLAVFGRHVGGLTSAGLTAVDFGKAESLGGMAVDFLKTAGRGPGTHAEPGARWSSFSPSQAEDKFREFLSEAQAPVLYEHRLSEVVKKGSHITSLRFENGDSVEAKVFLDATYEGDLLAKAGVSYRVGRESNDDYGETVDGFSISKSHQFRFDIDPYRTPGDPRSGLLPGISPEPSVAPGTGDRKIQAYNFRMWAVKADAGFPWPKPADYDPDAQALLLRYLTTKPDFPWDWTYRFGPLKLNVGDCNNAGPVSTDFVGGNYDWPEANYARREKIFQAHVTYQQGMMWFLAHDDRLPARIRDEANQFGLPRNEFIETGGWPHELYVREARRMTSDYVMTEKNCLGLEVAPDSVGLASYTMDSHNVQRVVVNGAVRAEGNVEHKIPRPYPVSYRSLVPKEKECDNLLVPVCVSSTHMAYGSIRMEPVFMILGQSAATAACMAIDEGSSVQSVSYDKLRKRLLEDHQKLDWLTGGDNPGR
jgi:hypothetical protein